MTRIFTSDIAAASGAGLRPWRTMAEYEAAIAAIPGLRGWYSPWNPAHRVDVGGKISQLTDRSGGGRHLLQATDAARPTVNENYFGTYGGLDRDAAGFVTASAQSMETLGNLFDGTGQWSYFAIVKQTGTTGTTGILNSAPISQVALINQSDAFTIRMNGTQLSLTSPVTIQNKLSVILATHNFPGAGNVSLYLERNGQSTTGTPVGAAGTPGTNKLRIGSVGSANGNGGMMEIIVVKGILTSDEMALLREYADFIASDIA